MIASFLFLTSLAETNRSPFDFAEGERELVRGFNVEYSRSSFAFLFIAEYLIILFMSLLLALLTTDLRMAIVCLFRVVVSSIFVWVRACLPRLRYDKLIAIC